MEDFPKRTLNNKALPQIDKTVIDTWDSVKSYFGAYAKFLRDKVVPVTPEKDKKAYSTKSEFIKKTWFGKTDDKHSFVAERVFEAVAIHIFKSGYLLETKQVTVGKCRVDLDILRMLIPMAKGVNFFML